MKSKRILSVIFTFALMLCAFAGLSVNVSAADYSWTGTWNTTWKEMELVQTGNAVKGTYSRASGQVSGTVSGNTFSGTWSQRTGKGKFVFTMSADGKSFSGTWGYNDNNDTYSDWTGTRNTVTYVTDNTSPAAPASASLSDVRWDSASKNLSFRLLFGNTDPDAWVGILPAGTSED